MIRTPKPASKAGACAVVIRTVCIGSVCIGMVGAVGVAVADPEKLAYGKHLAQECTTCHRPDGGGQSIPVIFGLEVDYIRSTMKFYRDGQRTNPVMNSVAQMLTDDQLDALAIYLSTQKPAPPAKPAPAKKR